MYPIVGWAATAVVFFTLELTTASFFFLWIGAGAALTALLSLFVEIPWVQYLAFALSSMFLVALSRPWAKRLSRSVQRASNVDSLVGQKARVTQTEKNQLGHGSVKVEGAVWKAESEDHAELKAGSEVQIVSVKGNTLVVKA